MTTARPNKAPFAVYKRAAVVGAAGKMGSGIALLLLQQMALWQLKQLAKQSQGDNYRLVMIDTDRGRLDGLRTYLRTQLLRWAEKNIIALRRETAELKTVTSNQEIIDCFLEQAMQISHFACALEEAFDAELIFEAIIEDTTIKIELFSKLKAQSVTVPYFFTNTSAIPLHVLDEGAGLKGKIIGFHFYNPPAVQKLLEIIPLEKGDPQLTATAKDIALELGKHMIISRDVAGVIGNGYLLREIMHACEVTRRLSLEHGLLESIYMVNRVTQQFLLRPMGIFQLIDYIGLDVIARVGEIMNRFLPEAVYRNELFESLLKGGVLGGQFSDGSQKDGFFQYREHLISGIYDERSNRYIPLETADWKPAGDAWLGDPPMGLSWKTLSKTSGTEEIICNYFESLKAQSSHGALLAINFLEHLQHICNQLVSDGVAASTDDVAAVLKNGFYHLYDPTKLLASTPNVIQKLEL